MCHSRSNVAQHCLLRGMYSEDLMRSILAALEGEAAAPAGAPVAAGARRLTPAPLAGRRRLRGTATTFAVVAFGQAHRQMRQGPGSVRRERGFVCDRIDADATLLRQQ